MLSSQRKINLQTPFSTYFIQNLILSTKYTKLDGLPTTFKAMNNIFSLSFISSSTLYFDHNKNQFCIFAKKKLETSYQLNDVLLY